ncbi:hypothetical protein ACF1BU_34745 [Streptomyces sp. NPDC014724]|uniref:hypothetical protein n=1 Tax=unclassified Streptomyces TaxID=2593676 RepID=UPI0036F66782
MDEEAVRLADVLEDHPGTSDVSDSGAQGDIVFAAAGGTWVLDFGAAAPALSAPPGPSTLPSGPARVPEPCHQLRSATLEELSTFLES